MVLKIDFSKLVHVPERSVYNHNVYNYDEGDMYIHEECDEFSNDYSYSAEDYNGNKFFLGCSYHSIKENPELEFGVIWT